MKPLINLLVVLAFASAINAQNKPAFYTDKGAKLIAAGNCEELKISNDVAVKIPIDSVFYQYDNIFIKIISSSSDPKASWPTMEAYKEYYKKDYKRAFKDKKELLLLILNPDDKSISYGGYDNFAGDFYCSALNERFGSSEFGLGVFKKKKKCILVQVTLIVKGYKVTGTKQKWNSNDQSWYTVDVYDDGETLSETQLIIN